jgi:PEGA domain-containing protein
MEHPQFASTVGLPSQPDFANIDPSQVVRMPSMPPPNRRPMWIALFAGAILVALCVGIAIGRASTDEPEVEVVATSDRGKLKVISTPKDSNVILDGRFVGVAPLENLDVDPGKHTIVVDVFGYEPYSGTVEVEARGNAKLTVVLGALNATEQTTGTVSGRGTLSRLTVPRSALMPTIPSSPPAGPVSKPAPQPQQRTVTIQRPKRDCSGENRNCKDGCYRADTDCRFSCPGCSSCNTSTGWDECKRQCDTCRNGCEQNKRFCDTSCSSQESSCEASNNY